VPTGFPETYAVFLTATGRVAVRRRSAVKPPLRLVDRATRAKVTWHLIACFFPIPSAGYPFAAMHRLRNEGRIQQEHPYALRSCMPVAE
jgi:hypothetical protein